MNQRAGELSGGQQQMLSVVRSYLDEPRLVLVDEVSMGLAPVVIDQIYEFLAKIIQEGASLLLVEQYVNRALAAADRVCVLAKGASRTTASPPASVRTSSSTTSARRRSPTDRPANTRTSTWGSSGVPAFGPRHGPAEKQERVMPGIRGRRALRMSGAAVAVMLLASACGSDDGEGTSAKARPNVADPKGTPIVIGSVGHFSGFAGATSKSSPDAVSAWAQWTNDNGGINGHPVKVVVKDDQADPAKALAAVKSLVEQDKVIALVGSHEAGLEAVWEKYAAGKGIPVLGGSSTPPSTRRTRCSSRRPRPGPTTSPCG